jgi:hypothetical protein
MKLYQIFYNSETKKKLLPGFTPYDNSKKLTKYFENSVILDIWKNHKKEWENTDLIGVFSPRLLEKTQLDYLKIFYSVCQEKSDCYFLTPINTLDNVNHFSNRGLNHNIELCKIIESEKLFPFRFNLFNESDCINFCNFWLLSPELFDKYCKDLEKLINWLENTDNLKGRELLHKKLDFRDNGLDYYPGVFLCEGFFALWININKIPFKYILPNLNSGHKSIRMFISQNQDKILTPLNIKISKITTGDQPIISIITRTVIGREILLSHNLNSVKNQKKSNWEQIIIKDYGKHGLLQAHKSMCYCKSNIDSDYVFFLDDDDKFINNDFTFDMEKIIKKVHPDIIFVKMIVKNPSEVATEKNTYPKHFGELPFKFAEIANSCFIITKEIYNKYIHFMSERSGGNFGGDYSFISNVLKNEKLKIYWQDKIYSETQIISRSK